MTLREKKNRLLTVVSGNHVFMHEHGADRMHLTCMQPSAFPQAAAVLWDGTVNAPSVAVPSQIQISLLTYAVFSAETRKTTDYKLVLLGSGNVLLK